MQKPGQLVPIGGGLIQENEEFAVGQHETGSIGTEKLLDVLRQPRHEAVVFADALPQLVEEVGAVRIPEQKVKFIGKDPCGFSFLPVLDHTVEDGVQRDQHANGHELRAKLPDVVGDDPGFGIHIGALGKSVQTAGDEQLRGKRQPSGFRLRLLQKGVIQIFEGRRLALIVVDHVFPVHVIGTSVEDGLLLCAHVAGAYQLLEQGEDEFGLFDQRIAFVAVGLVHIHGVQVGVRRGGYPDHFTAEGLDKEAEFRFRIQNQDIVVGGKGDADDFFLGGEGLAGTGNAEAKAVSV